MVPRKTSLIVIILCAAVFVALSGFHTYRLEPLAGGLRAPDFRAGGYTAEEFLAWARALGNDGRASFMRWHSHGLDALFPFLLSFTLGALLHRVLWSFPRYRAVSSMGRITLLCVVVAPYLLFDVFENTTIVEILRDPLDNADFRIAIASVLTVLKFSAAGFCLALIAAFGLAATRFGDRGSP